MSSLSVLPGERTFKDLFLFLFCFGAYLCPGTWLSGKKV